MTSPDIVQLSTSSFQSEILDAAEPALVDFTAARCAPCRALGPKVEALAATYRGRLKVGLLDVDDHPEVAQRYGVRAIPTLLLFRRGKVVEQLVGSGSDRKLEEAIRKVL